MSEQQTAETQENTEETSTGSTGHDQWGQVSNDFQRLGQSIASAITGLWNDGKNQEQLSEIQTGLQKMAEQVTRAINEAISSEAASGVKTEVGKAVNEAKTAGTNIYSDSKPFVVGALKKMNESIQTIVDRMENAQSASTAPVDEEE